MTKMNCRQCGSALTKGARFCTICGATATSAETLDIYSPETRPLASEQTDQIVPSHSAATEELPSNHRATQIVAQMAAQPEPSDYDTEEAPRTRITSQAEERSTADPAEGSVIRAQTESPPANQQSTNQPSRGRKGPLLAAALGVVVLGAGSFFFINSRRASGTQAANKPADEAKTVASAQPSTGPSIEPASPQEKNAADGSGPPLYNLNQGVAHFNAGRYQDALREFEYVKKLDPGNKSVYYLIGQTYHKMGQLERALEAYRQYTSGVYASVALNNVKALEKRLGKTN